LIIFPKTDQDGEIDRIHYTSWFEPFIMLFFQVIAAVFVLVPYFGGKLIISIIAQDVMKEADKKGKPIFIETLPIRWRRFNRELSMKGQCVYAFFGGVISMSIVLSAVYYEVNFVYALFVLLVICISYSQIGVIVLKKLGGGRE